MKQRGRQSAAANVVPLAATSNRPTLTPSRPLTKQEKQIFDLVVKEHRHLRTFDAPLLTGYAIACAKMIKLKDPTAFEKVARVAMSFATKLRLTPQSSTQAVTLGRRYAQQPNGERRPWDRHEADEEE
jgi:hypothetical protein